MGVHCLEDQNPEKYRGMQVFLRSKHANIEFLLATEKRREKQEDKGSDRLKEEERTSHLLPTLDTHLFDDGFNADMSPCNHSVATTT